MSILVVGSVAFDSVKTPYGEVENVLGGAANYFSMAARFFSPVRLVGVVGDDFPENHITYLESKKICTKGLSRLPGKTFHWRGEYGDDLSQARTLSTSLNVFEHFNPELPTNYRESEYLFLANIDPDLQLRVLQQMEKPKLIVSDTMNFWIDRKRSALERILRSVHLLLINEGEARQLTSEDHLIDAAKKIHELGPSGVVIKRGEYGSFLSFDGKIFVLPAYPLKEVRDPTGAGDTFAGGF
ncbi:MAG: PfkB family carbohydrate kinase, partial [Deltaproteobacteria bacterium]